MENVIYKEITLPEHEDLFGPFMCHECHGATKPCAYTHTFDLPLQGAKVKVSGIKAHKCVDCGEVIYSSAEAKLIEAELQKALSQEG